jgi:hypothetical protein
MRIAVLKVFVGLSFVVTFQLFVSASFAATEGKLPILPGAIEKVCSDNEKGACIESPSQRVQITSTENLTGVVNKLLNQSKKMGWKMNSVPSSSTPRYQSSNSKGYSLLWSVEKANTGADGSGKSVYYIYYWKIYGE